MFFYNFIFCCTLFLCYAEVVTSNEVKKKTEDVKHTFAKLLKSIVKVNEERMDAVKKIAQLQDYMLTKNKLKTDEVSYDSTEEDDRILLAFTNTPRLRRTEDETIAKLLNSRINFDNNNANILKQGCRRQSLQLCVNACNKFVARLCDKINCNHKTMSDFKTECHDDCQDPLEDIPK